MQQIVEITRNLVDSWGGVKLIRILNLFSSKIWNVLKWHWFYHIVRGMEKEK